MKRKTKYPDFIIVGAMKSGTTTLHNLLCMHKKIFIPKKEIFFFDIDDHFQHPYFFYNQGLHPDEINYEKNFEKYEKWYLSFFEGCKSDQIIGEDTTTYLASNDAPKRIAKLLPDVKIIIMLRDPVARAYSHYWHGVSNGLIYKTFEEVVYTDPGTILQRGLYKEQLEHYLVYFPKSQIKVIIFEDFISRTNELVKEVLHFIGINNTDNFKFSEFICNQARVPYSLKFYLFLNKAINSKVVHYKYQKHLPPNKKTKLEYLCNINKLNQLLFLSSQSKYPPMDNKIYHWLREYYNKNNNGLGALFTSEFTKYWGTLRNN